MRKNLKLLSTFLIASLVCNYTITSSNINSANARHSRKVVVNSNDTVNQINESNDDNSPTLYENSKDDENTNIENIDDNETTDEELADEELTDEELTDEEVADEEVADEEATEEEVTDEETTDDSSNENTLLSSLNSDKNLKIEDIAELVKPLAYSVSFKKELNTTFPNFNPLRDLSSGIIIDSNSYIDVNSNEIKNYSRFFTKIPNTPNVYSTQNTSNMLIEEINSKLTEINDEISSQPNSTIFSTLPTVLAFSDTLEILKTEYNNILENNFDNKIKLNILLKDVEKNLSTLLESVNEFKKMLPESIEMLNNLITSDKNTTNKETEDEEVTDEELTDEELTDEETTDEEVTDEETTNEETTEEEVIDEETTDEEVTDEEVIEETADEEIIEENSNSNEEINKKENIDPKKVILYFGEQGQELTFNEKNKKYYEINPEDPDSEELIEYSGEVSKMTLEEYLNMDLYFDEQGNELIYDGDTNSYFLYNAETDEFSLYEGKITKMKMKELLEKKEKDNQ